MQSKPFSLKRCDFFFIFLGPEKRCDFVLTFRGYNCSLWNISIQLQQYFQGIFGNIFKIEKNRDRDKKEIIVGHHVSLVVNYLH